MIIIISIEIIKKLTSDMLYMLWFKFLFGSKISKLVHFLFSFVLYHYHNLEQWQIKLKPVQKTLNQG